MYCSTLTLHLNLKVENIENGYIPKSIELFMDDQALSPAYHLTPTPSPPPPFLVSKLNRRHTERLRNSLTGWGGGGGQIMRH
jgi:hypothetical protein